MPLTIRTYLANRDCQFTGRTIRPEGSFDENVAAAHLPTDHVARAHILQNGRARIMVVIPADRQLDTESLETLLRRPFTPCSRRELAEVVPECDPESIPPVGEPYGLSVILDRNLIGLDRIYFAAGVTDLFVCMSGSEFARLHAHSLRKLQISTPVSDVAAVDELLDLQPQEGTDELLTTTLADDLELERILEESAGLDIADVIAQEETSSDDDATNEIESESLPEEIELLTGLTPTEEQPEILEETSDDTPKGPPDEVPIPDALPLEEASENDDSSEEFGSDSIPEEIELPTELTSVNESWEFPEESADEVSMEAPNEVQVSDDFVQEDASANDLIVDAPDTDSPPEELELPTDLTSEDDNWEISEEISNEDPGEVIVATIDAESGEHIVEDLPDFDDSILELSAATDDVEADAETELEREPNRELHHGEALEDEIPLLSQPVEVEVADLPDKAEISDSSDEFPVMEDIVEPLASVETDENPVVWDSDPEVTVENTKEEFSEAPSEEFNLEDTLSGEPLSMEMRVEPTPPDPEVIKRNKLRKQLQALRKRIRAKIETATELPAMPGIAGEIISLRNNAYSTPVELAAVIEQDPALSAQLVRYATSSLYAYQGKVDTVETAIVRVLGVDFVFNLALGLSLGRTFDNPKDGPIGLDAFWQHAVRTATLSQSLCNNVPIAHRPSPGSAYLAGLIHNFGFLLLGHYFPREFLQLNQLIAKFPQRSIPDIEARTIGLTHCELGAWLMKAWKMPKEIIAVVEHHHEADFEGDYADYVGLTFIANALLKQHEIGDSETDQVPDHLLQRLHLTADATEAALVGVMEAEEGLDFIARRMTA